MTVTIWWLNGTTDTNIKVEHVTRTMVYLILKIGPRTTRYIPYTAMREWVEQGAPA